GEVVEGSKVTALLFSDYGRFRVLNRQCGLLLCMGITQREVKYAARQSSDALEQELRDAGIYPVTDFERILRAGSGCLRFPRVQQRPGFRARVVLGALRVVYWVRGSRRGPCG